MSRTELLQKLGEREFNLDETMLVLRANPMVYMSWGVSGLWNFENKVLILKVNGHHHKGYVMISLAWNDTYTVNIVSTHNNIKKTYTEVYFDMLVDVIDTHIKRIADYKV